jgi:hypothetical protein
MDASDKLPQNLSTAQCGIMAPPTERKRSNAVTLAQARAYPVLRRALEEIAKEKRTITAKGTWWTGVPNSKVVMSPAAIVAFEALHLVDFTFANDDAVC